jgi:predicted O-methyltransferase YrrM
MQDPSEVWTGFAESYDRTRPSPPPALLDLLMQLAGYPHPALVVDVGSGTGLSTMIRADRADLVVEIDWNARRSNMSGPNKSSGTSVTESASA